MMCEQVLQSTQISTTTVLDYALVIIPIILSLIAIWISISTAKKQNRIALFELRYKCISQIKAILAFDAGIYDCEQANIILCLFDAYWHTSLIKRNYDDRLIEMTGVLEKIQQDILQAEFLFDHRCQTDLAEVSSSLRTVMLNVVNGDLLKEDLEVFHENCERLYKTDFSKLVGETRLYN